MVMAAYQQKYVPAGKDHWDGNQENLYYWTKFEPLYKQGIY
jgi:hypothetical protein